MACLYDILTHNTVSFHHFMFILDDEHIESMRTGYVFVSFRLHNKISQQKETKESNYYDYMLVLWLWSEVVIFLRTLWIFFLFFFVKNALFCSISFVAQLLLTITNCVWHKCLYLFFLFLLHFFFVIFSYLFSHAITFIASHP